MEEKLLKKIGTFLDKWEKKEILKKIDEFHEKRIEKLKRNETPAPLTEGAKMVLYYIPVGAFKNSKYYDLSEFNKRIHSLGVNRVNYLDQTYNFDSLFCYIESERKCDRYFQISTNGIIDTVDSKFYSKEEKIIYLSKIEEKVIAYTKDAFLIQKELGVKPPVAFYFNLLGISGLSFPAHQLHFPQRGHPIYVDDLNFPKIIVDKFDIEVENLLRITFYRMWNACGYPKSFNYDTKGERIKK